MSGFGFQPGEAPKGPNAFRISENSAFTRVANYDGYRPGPLFQGGPLNFGVGRGVFRRLEDDLPDPEPAPAASPGGGAGLQELPAGQPPPAPVVPALPTSPQGGGPSTPPFIYGSLD